MDFSASVQPVLLGLSSGLVCVTTCLPIFGPMMVFEERKAGACARIFFQFIFGRFFGYIIFGAAFGFLGERLNAGLSDKVAAVALVFLSVLMIIYSLDRVRGRKTSCPTASGANRVPFLVGFLTGVNVCPPFLLALGVVLTLHSAIRGMIFFTLFFLGTTVYFFPVLLFGPLARWKEMRFAARAAGFCVGCLYLVQASLRILKP